jgi:rod shape-determining protein MreC
MISAGRNDGVVPGLPAIGADGLIGRTIEAGAHAARLLLLTDPASRIPVTVVRTGQAALLVGTNRPALELRDRVGADVPLKPGDRLVTSGDGGIFPPGIPVGTVISAAEPIEVRPAAHPVGAGFVRIEAAYLPLPVEAAPPAFDTPVPIEARRSGGGRPPATPAAPLQ